MLMALTQPGLVERLLILDIAPVRYHHSYLNYVNAMKDIDLSQILSRADVELIISNVIRKPETRGFLMQNLVRNNQGGYKWRVNFSAFKSHMTDILGFPEISRNKAYTGKALFLGGHKSDYITTQYQRETRRLFPDSNVEFIDNAGHWIHADQPKAVLEKLRNFLGHKTMCL
jgi:pimeloyl-ACP methyl ester carboxylesterase